MPQREGDTLVVNYIKTGGVIYGYSSKILPFGEYNSPATVSDFVVEYYDSTTVSLRWTAPHGDLPTDKVNYYEIRYANSQVDAFDQKVWMGLGRVMTVPVPEKPGIEQKLTINDFAPNKEYYIYIKSVQIIKGNLYTSFPSTFAYCKTISSSE
ncbi:MAG: hypothetical protein EOM35_07085 [Negativicutes bacterium]|nr:hypothetical protein [Negativicutes bacterium]